MMEDSYRTYSIIPTNFLENGQWLYFKKIVKAWVSECKQEFEGIAWIIVAVISSDMVTMNGPCILHLEESETMDSAFLR